MTEKEVLELLKEIVEYSDDYIEIKQDDGWDTMIRVVSYNTLLNNINLKLREISTNE